jgi:hypothetical protein
MQGSIVKSERARTRDTTARFIEMSVVQFAPELILITHKCTLQIRDTRTVLYHSLCASQPLIAAA